MPDADRTLGAPGATRVLLDDLDPRRRQRGNVRRGVHAAAEGPTDVLRIVADAEVVRDRAEPQIAEREPAGARERLRPAARDAERILGQAAVDVVAAGDLQRV